MDTIIRIITPKEKEMREKFPELYKQVDRLNKLIENTDFLVIYINTTLNQNT